MFGLFKRTKIADWEIRLLKNVLLQLPQEYTAYINPIDNGLFKGIWLNASTIPGYNAFRFNPEVYKRYSDPKGQNFKITGIRVYDTKSAAFLPYEVYFYKGIIDGYALTGNKHMVVDPDTVDVSDFRKQVIGDEDYKRIAHLFSNQEKKLLNPFEIYAITLGNVEFFHIKALEDGNFIAVDLHKTFYRVTHDPFEVKILTVDLAGALSQSE